MDWLALILTIGIISSIWSSIVIIRTSKIGNLNQKLIPLVFNQPNWDNLRLKFDFEKAYSYSWKLWSPYYAGIDKELLDLYVQNGNKL